MAFNDRMGCPNLDVKIEGKGIISSGNYVCYCRADGNKKIPENVVISFCVDNHGLSYGQCCNLVHSRRTTLNKPASYEKCQILQKKGTRF